jgi:hypothetical protein
MKNIQTFESFLNESFHAPDGTPIGVDQMHRPIAANEAKLVGDDWKAWLDIEEAIRGIYIKYNKKVDPKKISEFIQEHVDEYKMVGPTLK